MQQREFELASCAVPDGRVTGGGRRAEMLFPKLQSNLQNQIVSQVVWLAATSQP